jgi:hypothetical protein
MVVLRKHPEPGPRRSRARVFAGQRIGHFHTTAATGLVRQPHIVGTRQLLAQALGQALRQHQQTVFAAFARTHDQGTVREVDVLDPQLQPFRQPHAGTVKHFGKQPRCTPSRWRNTAATSCWVNTTGSRRCTRGRSISAIHGR